MVMIKMPLIVILCSLKIKDVILESLQHGSRVVET